MRERQFVELDRRTLEYLTVLIGQIPFGNEQRRREACADLAAATASEPLVTARECFECADWVITCQRK